jgi:hypothetical protein
LSHRYLAQTYDESGWCFVEAAISAGVKIGNRRFDLGHRWLGAQSKLVEPHSSPWGPYAIQTFAVDPVCASRRPPPIHPDEARRLLRDKKKFTARADVETVAYLYQSFFETVAQSAKALYFRNLKWEAEVDGMQLALVLPHFSSLTHLDLSENALYPVGVKALAAALPAMGSLTSLNLSDTRLCGMHYVYYVSPLSGEHRAVRPTPSNDYGETNGYTAEGLEAIAAALRNASLNLKSLDLGCNVLYGTWQADSGSHNRGTYRSDGIRAITEAVKASPSLAYLKLDEVISPGCDLVPGIGPVPPDPKGDIHRLREAVKDRDGFELILVRLRALR